MKMYQIEKYGWKYLTNGQKDNMVFDVIPPENGERPTILYKLFSLNGNSVDGLLNQYIYATHPHQFNDIFDCHEDLIEFDDPDAIRFFIKEYAMDLFPSEKLENDLKNNFYGISNFVKRNFREMLYQMFGVYSMTTNPSSLLMWSYYTNHQGFFIEFDITKFPFKFHGPFPVNYQENITPISVSECGIPLAVLLQTNLKHKGWFHENEWRLIVESNERMYSPSFEQLRKLGGHDRKFKYPIEAVKTVGFGNRFFPPEELHIISDKIMNITLKHDIERKRKVLDFLIENKIRTCFSQRDGLMKISYGGMVIEKQSDTEYVFNAAKWNEG